MTAAFFDIIMRNFLTSLSIGIFATLMFTLASCQDQPESSETKTQIIEKGQSIYASIGTLVFYICNDFPDIYPVPGMSNYCEAPTISFVGVVGSIDEITLNTVSEYHDKCEIVDNGGYIARVKWYDPTIHENKVGYMIMFLEIIRDSHTGTNSIIDPNKIRITYKLMTQA